MEKNIETFIGCDSDYEDAKLVIFGAPMDATTSFKPGTRFAMKAMRSESYGIETYSPYQDKDMMDIATFDGGTLDLPFGNVENSLSQIGAMTASIVGDGKIPIMIGGEHLVSLPAIRAVFEKYPDLCVIHFDAHADLIDEYIGQKLSHGSIIRRVHEFLGDDRIYQFGIRSGSKEEFTFAKTHTKMTKFSFENLEVAIQELRGKPVYFTLDLDVLDPSVMCGTGTPDAGGVTYKELLEAVFKVGTLNIVGADINELAPNYDSSGVSTAAACKLLRELILTFIK